MNEPIRILHILQRMEAGGTQALLMSIYRKIDRSKVQFDFVVEYPEKQFYDDEIIALGGKIYYTSVRKDFNFAKFQKILYQILKDHPEYKIVHVHAYTIGYFCLRTAKKAGVPVRIAHSHSNGIVHDKKYYIKLLMQKLFLLHATDFMACSEEAGKYLFKGKDYVVLNNAIDSSKFIAQIDVRNNLRKEIGLSDKFVVGHVGRLCPEKNHMFLIDVFAQIKKMKENAMLVLVGTGPLEQEIKQKVSDMGLTDSVIFLGNRKDMNRIYQILDIFIFPSLFEGLGIVAVEAQAAGIPVIGSEGLPPEIEITPLFHRIDIKEGARKWAELALYSAENSVCHSNMQKYVIDAGFDMDATANMIQQYYLKKWN